MSMAVHEAVHVNGHHVAVHVNGHHVRGCMRAKV